MKKASLFPLTILFLLMMACSLFTKPVAEETESSVKTVAVATMTPTKTVPTPASIPSETEIPSVEESEVTRSQWAEAAESDLNFSDTEMAIGMPDEDLCGEGFSSWRNIDQDPDPGPYYLQLNYRYPLIPTEVNIVISGNFGGKIRVETLDSSSGLGQDVYEGDVKTGVACPATFTIPVKSDQYADRVVLTFDDEKMIPFIDAVELKGVLPGYSDLPVFWRIEIPGDDPTDADSQFPGGLAVDDKNTIYVANGRMGLQRYDLEGNLLKEYSIPDISNLTDVAIDLFDNIVITDSVWKWFIIFDKNGLQINAGGEEFGWSGPTEVAINPVDGNVYVLDETDDYSRIRVYTSDRAEWVRDFDLEAGNSSRHKGLAFDQSGFLYTIDQIDGVILKIDPEDGEIIENLGYRELQGSGPSDLALDRNGNIYVLLNSSNDDSAVYIFNNDGELTRRLGKLTYDGSGWGEGVFLFPVAVAVTGDGCYLIICENGILTSYWLGG